MSEFPKDDRSDTPLAVIVLAAGHGTRMQSELPKVLHQVGGLPMIDHVLDTVEAVSPAKVVVVIGPDMADVGRACRHHTIVVQEERLGTGHAVLQAKETLEGFAGNILVVFGDTPLLTADTILLMKRALDDNRKHVLAVLGFIPEIPTGYGRIRCKTDGTIESIVEELDANSEDLKTTLCNSGVMIFRAEVMFKELVRVKNQNVKGEYYLTDLVSLVRDSGEKVGLVVGLPDELQGVNSRMDLANAESIMQNRLRIRAMGGGVTLIDPGTTWLSMDTTFGKDVTVGPNVFLGKSVEVGDRVEIKAFSHLEGVKLSSDVIVGPFARLRPGTVIDSGAKIGNFVEIKAAHIGRATKVSHLTYIGDSNVGEGVNIGAGTITCNYDGLTKHLTEIADGAFIGSNSALVAPVSIGENAIVGAGSVVTDDIEEDELSVTRAEQKHLKGGATRWRGRRSTDKS